MSADSYILTFSRPNRPGIVAAVARALFESGGNIQEAHQYDDVETNAFFLPASSSISSMAVASKHFAGRSVPSPTATACSGRFARVPSASVC
jgi:formyltetrahydrofolate hydrolase